MATHIKADGTEKKVNPKSGKKFTLEELQGFVGGYVEIVNLGGRTMLVNEDGIPKKLTVNVKASMLAGQTILGDVLIPGPGQF